MANNPKIKVSNDQDDLLTYGEAVAYCRLRSTYLLRDAVRKRELSVVALGRRNKRFRRGELDRWLKTKQTKLVPR